MAQSPHSTTLRRGFASTNRGAPAQSELTDEFPPGVVEWPDGISRRKFISLMAASAALAGGVACTRQPLEKIVPYVHQPELVVPGEPLHFASAHLLGGYARGILVESHEGRPTKIEGNPEHPASLGAADIFMQASILDLYDPDRSKTPLHGGQPATWDTFQQALSDIMAPLLAKGGAGLRILTETITSPTLLEMFVALQQRLPEMQWLQAEPFHRGNGRIGAKLAFGHTLDTIYHFDKANVVVALDADFLTRGPASIRQAHDFADRRRVALDGHEMCRLFVAEPAPTLAGAMADDRIAVRASEIISLAQALHQGALSNPTYGDDWTGRVIQALVREKESGIVLAGDDQPPEVHALAHRLNALLGNIGKTITYIDPIDSASHQPNQDLLALADDLRAGKVETLLILSGNPLYSAPDSIGLAEAVNHAKLRIHLGSYEDETSRRCHWHLPEAHFLESWSDARAFDGMAGIIQPLIEPLYDGRGAIDVIAMLLGNTAPDSHQILQNSWKRRGLTEDAWNQSLRRGTLSGTQSPEKHVQLTADSTAAVISPTEQSGASTTTLEIAIRPDSNIFDGRFANNGWLQELPRPLNGLSWDNAIFLSPATAGRYSLRNGDLAEIRAGDTSVRGPVIVMPGHANDAVTLPFGYGRTHAGTIGTGVGFRVANLQLLNSTGTTRNVLLRKLPEKLELAFTQLHHAMEGRDLIHVFSSNDAIAEASKHAREHPAPSRDETLFHPDEFENPGYAWGMVIDLNTCIGCNACIVACQAENNIPVVGKVEVRRGRDMQWIRVDNYFERADTDPRIYFQPVPCMHCENAPCELVCPVAATVTDHEGLNVQVYNRCIGTRYCSNNCPYKVRRFNFLEYTESDYENAPIRRMLRNPNVTVRSRGVMEKCTYCLQRISRARIQAKREDRRIQDGEVQPACAQTCPAHAIHFGDLHDPASAVARLQQHPFQYAMLAELNTHPRTTYLARLTSPRTEVDHGTP